MRSLIVSIIAAITVLSACQIGLAQSGSGNAQSNLRARLPFSGPASDAAGRLGTNSPMRPTTGSTNTGYGGWAGVGYPRAAGNPSLAQPYARGRGPMWQMQRPNLNGVAATDFNPANPNVQPQNVPRDGGRAESAYSGEDFAWMDEERGVQERSLVDGTSVGSNSLSRNDSNAANAQAATAAATSGTNWPTLANGQTSREGVATNQQGAPWRFYNTPAYEQMPSQQPMADGGSAANAVVPTQSQKPAGVAEAATGAPIKF